MIIALFCSCNKGSVESEPVPFPHLDLEPVLLSDLQSQKLIEYYKKTGEEYDESVISYTVILLVRVAIFDERQNDRFNPVSDTYFGDDFIKGIDVLHRKSNNSYESRKNIIKNNASPEELKNITGVVYHPRGTRKYYTLDCSNFDWFFLEGDNVVSFTYIQYPDGIWDEIKVQIIINDKGNIVMIEKLWINDDLAFSMSESIKASIFRGDLSKSPEYDYYNTTYYPWMERVVDYYGNLTEFYRPVPEMMHIAVLTK